MNKKKLVQLLTSKFFLILPKEKVLTKTGELKEDEWVFKYLLWQKEKSENWIVIFCFIINRPTTLTNSERATRKNGPRKQKNRRFLFSWPSINKGFQFKLSN